jgi:hypothetical protein
MLQMGGVWLGIGLVMDLGNGTLKAWLSRSGSLLILICECSLFTLSILLSV